MATGFAKWGMTGGTAAALVLADALQGRENPWASLFDPNRFKPLAAASRFVEENARVGLHFVGDRLKHRGTRPIEELAPGEGDIVRHAGEKVAGHRARRRDARRGLARCAPTSAARSTGTRAERSWDCPCHGSRFSPDGDVLQGPAVHRLEHKPVG